MKSMTRMLVLALAALALVLPQGARAQESYSNIGLYMAQDADQSTTSYNGAPGVFTAYAVLTDPRNIHTGAPDSNIESDIYNVGGFEFKIVLPASVFLLSGTLPPGAINFLTPPNYLVGCNIPVTQYPDVRAATLVTFTFGAFVQNPDYIYVSPVDDYPSIPGLMAITDYADDFRLNPAYPASGDFAAPVFGLWNDVGPFPDGWTVGVAALGDGITVGVDSGATDWYDAAYDIADDNVTVTMPRPEWSGYGSSYYASDIRAAYDPLAEVKSWTFQVNVPDQSGSVTDVDLVFSPTFAAADGFRLRLADDATGQTTDLGPSLQYTFATYGGQYDFTLLIGDDTPPGPVNVAVGFSATINQLVDDGNLATVDPLATDGYDPGFDLPEPGPPPSAYVVASIERPGWPLGPRFERDVRSVFDPLVEQRVWPILVETDQSGIVSLDFTANFTEADGIDLHLRDLQTGQVVSLLPSLHAGFATTGQLAYRFELIVGGDVLPPLNPAATTVTGGWSLVAPPLMPFAGAETLNDVILDQAPGYAYLFDYSHAAGYTRLDGSETTGVGRGYWIATDQAFSWTMAGDFAVDPVIIPLEPGWNLVGYPLWFPSWIDGVRVTDGNAVLTWEQALTSNWVSGMVSYDPARDDYVLAQQLLAWHGYWASALRSGLSLVFDWHNAVNASGVAKSAIEVPEADGWRCVLRMDDGSGLERRAEFGVDTRATDGFDAAFDLPRPPASPSGGASIAMVRPDWKLPCGNSLAADIAAMDGAGVRSWTARIMPQQPGQVTLTWTSHRWPAGVDLEMYLPGENRVVLRSMRETGTVTLPVGAAPVDVVLRTPGSVSGVGDEVPFAGYDVSVHPNPFNPQTTIAFSLPHDGRVDVRVYNVRGALVAELGGATMTAGRQQVEWNGRDRDGRSLPSGSYFARVILDGRPVGETARMSLVR